MPRPAGSPRRGLPPLRRPQPNESLTVNLTIDVALDYWFKDPCDVLLQVEAAQGAGQIVEDTALTVPACDHLARVPALDGIGTRIWLRAHGQMVVDYRAKVRINRPVSVFADLPIMAPRFLPGEAVPYLMPSRYCQSNLLRDFVDTQFGTIAGGAKIAAMCDWIADHLSYVPGSSHGDTTAVDTFHAREGICRDYAHLMVTFARAADVPARVASVYAPGVSPPDFHAVAEVFLGGAWHLVDATGMAGAQDTVIIGVGRDIGDVAFLTAFGALEMRGQSVSVTAADT
ncbi:transglutaminase [Porphyrobacter sp. TH134]|nr:transglutaminase [Porphyrobacter sp. TH134]